MKDNKKEKLTAWHSIKNHLHEAQRIVQIKEGEIWWCSIGENIGTEINGKGKFFSRPILIYRKLGAFQFLGIPLTTQEKTGSWYVNFRFQGKEQYASLNQIRTESIFRLQERMGIADKSDMRKIRTGFLGLYT